MIHEMELKLELTAEGANVVEASSLLPGKSSGIEQRSIYFDTPDLLLSKAGLSLRIRQANGVRVQTVKGQGANAAGLFVRSEWEQSVDDDQPILDDTNPIYALLGEKVHAIGPIFEVNINRQNWVIQEDENLIEISLDRGEAIAGDRKAAICEIELELKAGNSSALFAWARKIDAIAPAHLGVLSKAERGQRLREAVVDSVKAEPILLEQDMTLDLAFQQIAGSTLRQFRLNEALIEEQNPDALHQARVGLRRLRSAMTIFKPILVDKDYRSIVANLRWLTGELGKARNLDVLTVRATTQPLHDTLEEARINAYLSVTETLESTRARAFLINLAEWIADGRWLSQTDAEVEIKQASNVFARHVLRRLRKKLKKAGNLATLSDEQRHQVRKNAKKLRYASEFFSSLFEEKDARRKYKRFVKALERLQNKLGALNDLAMVPEVLAHIGIGDSFQAQQILSTSKKPKLLNSAAEAYDELLYAKRFWG